jgi:hypothetical protein
MSLPAKWVDAIFDRLSIAFGRDFLGRWEGMPIAKVKADWAECLKGFVDRPQAIAFGLANLPDSKPPTAQEFRAVCRQAPTVSHVLLPAPKAEESLVAEQLRKIASEALRFSNGAHAQLDNLRWAKRLKVAHELGERLSLVQIESYQAALGERKAA